jgi:uncharacterized membrane protein YhaH (DUF805 family)
MSEAFSDNPYASTVDPRSRTALDFDPNRKTYGGLGRLWFSIITVIIGVVHLVAAVFLNRLQGQLSYEEGLGVQWLRYGLIVMAGTSYFVLMINRLKNVGMSPWYSLLLVVPVINIALYVRCIVVPEGYVDSGQLGPTGRVMAIAAVVTFPVILVVALIYFFSVFMPQQL